MKRLLQYLILFPLICHAQSSLAPLTVDKIMRDPKWIGSSPSSIKWNTNGEQIYFMWNPANALSDSMYSYKLGQPTPFKLTNQYPFGSAKNTSQTEEDLTYSYDRSMWLYEQNNDIFFQSKGMSFPLAVTSTMELERNPVFSFNETEVVYTKGDNLYAWNIASGSTQQLTNFVRGTPSKSSTKETLQDTWLHQDQLREFDILAKRKSKKEHADSVSIGLKFKSIRPIYIEDKFLTTIQISQDGKYISYKLNQSSKSKSTIVPSYVTESGYTDVLNARSKVGSNDGPQELYLYDRIADTTYQVMVDSLPGITAIPEFYKDYPKLFEKMKKDTTCKKVSFSMLRYSASGQQAMVDIRSLDNKDRWISAIDLKSGTLQLIDHQHDEAWIGGPGIGSRFGGGNQGWIAEDRYWYQSEKTGYSHVYVYDMKNKRTAAVTEGKYEVMEVTLSKDKSTFYLLTNQTDPGVQQLYHVPSSGGASKLITPMIGAHQITYSPNGLYLAYLYSYSNKPWELYVQENRPGTKPIRVTDQAISPEFASYPWRDPEIVSFNARDGALVKARLYRPAKKYNNKAAVIFVHGAGYLQNAHKWWSSYFREYMFHNLLADQGYTVLDIDYRGSAGYGRDWRTAIYRHMGGVDLTDQIDGTKYLTEQLKIDPKKIGVYGGSYGGFITLMGLFTAPEVFAAGAALRPVTDWAQYNHPYTANILNTPATDSIAYRLSSPFYYANGLSKPLLICHGMVDVNVHYQDAVKLAQRLIELKKENWELASYPMEDHGFVEPSSWTDEYKRILKLFNQWLK